MLKENAISVAIVNHRSHNVFAALGGHNVCPFEFLAAYISYDLYTFWCISIFTVDIGIYAALINVINVLLGQRGYEIEESCSFNFASFLI